MKFLSPFPTLCTRQMEAEIDDKIMTEFLLKIGYKFDTECPVFIKEEQELRPYTDMPISRILLDNIEYDTSRPTPPNSTRLHSETN